MDHTAFEHLLELNRNVDAAIATLRKLGEYRELKNEDFAVRQIYLREHLTDANIHILHALEESEMEANGIAFKGRRAYEKKTRDPDDCYLEVMRREEERRQQGLPSLIGIQRGMRRATADEILTEIHAELERNAASPGVDDAGASVDGAEPAETDLEIEDDDEAHRQRIIYRVASLRTARKMTEEDFRTLIGPPASKSWTGFVAVDASEAWNHGTPAMFERIARALGVSSGELLR